MSLGETMTGTRIQLQTVDFLQFLNLLHAALIERAFPIERMQDNSFQEVSKS